MLETLCIGIRRSKDIQGITVDTEEIKLGLFADDLTGFLKNDISLQKFLELVYWYTKNLCIGIRRSKDIQGITVDTEEIKLGLFADDLTGFLKNDISLQKFLELVEVFGECSGLRINHDKSEVMLLGNSVRSSLRNDTEIKNLEIKHSVKFLGVHFTYDSRTKRKLNFDEIVTSIKQKLHIWRWRDLTIFGRIQIVKTFIIPISCIGGVWYVAIKNL